MLQKAQMYMGGILILLKHERYNPINLILQEVGGHQMIMIISGAKQQQRSLTGLRAVADIWFVLQINIGQVPFRALL